MVVNPWKEAERHDALRTKTFNVMTQLGQFENLQSELGSEAVGFDGRRQNYKFHSGARRQSS